MQPYPQSILSQASQLQRHQKCEQILDKVWVRVQVRLKGPTNYC